VTSRILTLTLVVALALSFFVLAPQLLALRVPGNNQGYEPPQPIAFSHRLHAGDLQVQCLFCHSGAERSRHAGIPPASVCMNCHRFVTAPLGALRAEDDAAARENRKPRRIVSPELQKLYDALALDEAMQPAAGKATHPIVWAAVHRLPDFVYFDHRPHVVAGLACQMCHGPVETMTRVRQEHPLTMGWCVNCHRELGGTGGPGKPTVPLIDCSTCHF
jgi:hypothetical protein